MSLRVLSPSPEPLEETFKNVALASSKGKLDFGVAEYPKLSEDPVETILQKRFGNGEDDYEYFFMNVIPEKEQIENFESGDLDMIYKEVRYYIAAATDNTPSSVCYYFSLAYLRLRPTHKISIYDLIYGLEEIEKVENRTGFIDGWSKGIA